MNYSISPEELSRLQSERARKRWSEATPEQREAWGKNRSWIMKAYWAKRRAEKEAA